MGAADMFMYRCMRGSLMGFTKDVFLNQKRLLPQRHLLLLFSWYHGPPGRNEQPQDLAQRWCRGHVAQWRSDWEQACGQRWAWNFAWL
mmetsp:Transcript_118993/g.331991  ORF Transcript_118993/g.331991 Transcript_118993/m.331991 type:complete len:88 (+) Transcript_118993:58-321(+)